MKIIITIDNLDPEFVDESHEMGVTDRGFDLFLKMLSPYGDVDIAAAED